MTDDIRIALMNREACPVKVIQDGELLPEPKHDRTPLNPEKRTFGYMEFTGFHLAANVPAAVAYIWGQRSDGQFFEVCITVDSKIMRQSSPEALSSLVREQFSRAMNLFQSYKDCSCGLIGYELSETEGSDGYRMQVPVYSPCEQHRPESKMETK